MHNESLTPELCKRQALPLHRLQPLWLRLAATMKTATRIILIFSRPKLHLATFQSDSVYLAV